MMLAFEAGQLEIAKYLLENGGEASTINEEGDNCFTIACNQGHVPLVAMLMDKAIVKLFGAMDEAGNGALHLAAQGHVDTLKYLLEKGAFVNVPSAESKATALHMAIMSGKVDNVKLLLSKGADVSKVTASGLTPLMCCCSEVPTSEAIEMATLILDAKADINKVAPFGATAYDIAESVGAFGIARFLLERGATPKGTPANTIGVDTFNTTVYFQAGEVPPARTRAASVVIGNTLFLGGGIRTRSVAELESELLDRPEDEEFDEASIMPFAAQSDLYSADLSKISIQPLVKDLTTIKGLTAGMSTKLKGDHVSVENNVISVTFVDDCCGSDDCTDDACAKKESEDKKEEEEHHEHKPAHSEDGDNAHAFVTSVLAEESFTAESTSVAYFEVTVVSTKSVEEQKKQEVVASVGFTSIAGEWEFEKHPGWTESSIGFHSDDGRARVLSEEEEEEQEIPWTGHRWGVNDTVGVGHIFATGETFFTLNGRFLGVPVAAESFGGSDLRAVVGAGSDGIKLVVNFGARPFRFNFHASTVTWTKLPNLPGTYLALLPVVGSTNEILVVPDSTKSVFHYNIETHVVAVKECKAAKISEIPLHAEHSINVVGNKVVLFARQETILAPTKSKNGLLMVLDLATLSWNNLLAPINIAQKKLVKSLSDIESQLSATAVGNSYYIFSAEKAYTLNLANLSLTALKLAGLPGNEDMGFYPYAENRVLNFSLSPNMLTYRFHLIDVATKQWYLPRFSPCLYEPIVGKAIAQYNGKFFSFGGFSSTTSAVKDFFVSYSANTTANPAPVRGLAAAFNSQEYSDATVVVGDVTFNVHKVVASARSSVLAKAFAEGSAFTAPAGIEAVAAQAVLKYLYSDSIDIALVTAKNFKAVTDAVRALAPEQENRLLEELLFSTTETASTFDQDILAALSKFENLADLTIENNGAAVKAHRVILASRSAGLKEKIGSGSSIKLEFSSEAVKAFVSALYAVCSFDIAQAPRSTWDELTAIGQQLNTCCLDRCVLAAKSVFADEVPTATAL